MQPVRITPMDRLLTKLYQARQTGRLKPGQTVVEIVPQHLWNDQAFAVRLAPGQYQVLDHLAFNEVLAANYAEQLRQRGFALDYLFGVDYEDQDVVEL